MQKIIPQYSRTKIDKAGDVLRANGDSAEDEKICALDILSNWRASYNYPINTFQASLRKKANDTCKCKVIVAQRLKRMPSIVDKLRRFSRMRLTQMQDIGGLRAVVNDTKDLYALREAFVTSKFKHILVNENDYITKPRGSGYRGIHLIYRYKSDKTVCYNKHMLEIQLRTKLQHTWAMAVETAGLFLNQSLKSSLGDKDWLNFFQVTGNAFALMEDGETFTRKMLPQHKAVFNEVVRMQESLNVIVSLEAFGAAFEYIASKESLEKSSMAYYLLIIKLQEKTIVTKPFTQSQFELATAEYLKEEKALSENEHVVLVSVDSLKTLKQAFPSFFADSKEFIKKLQEIQKL